MADERNDLLAKETFDTLCQSLESHELKFLKDEENQSINLEMTGDDLPIQIRINVDSERQLVMLLSHVPIKVNEDKRLDMAVAISAINNMLVDGSFDYDIKSGHIFFRMTNSFKGSKLSEDVFEYMLVISVRTVDEYNDKFLMLSKGMLALEKFISTLND